MSAADPLDPVEALLTARTALDEALRWTDSGGNCAHFIDLARAALAALPAPEEEGLRGKHGTCVGVAAGCCCAPCQEHRLFGTPNLYASAAPVPDNRVTLGLHCAGCGEWLTEGQLVGPDGAKRATEYGHMTGPDDACGPVRIKHMTSPAPVPEGVPEGWRPSVGERVLFGEDGNWVTGTVVAQDPNLPPGTDWAIVGDRGGVHDGPLVFHGEQWVWPLAPIIARISASEDQMTDEYQRCDLPTCRICDAVTPAAPAPEGVPEDRIVPEGWRIVRAECRHYDPTENHPGYWLVQDPVICMNHRLVPLSDTPHEEGAEQ